MLSFSLSIAVGNAAFHSAELYSPLAASIPPLLSALDDDDEKTRANAAGALGNLVRNGSELALELCRCGAVDRLIVMCLRERIIFPQVPLLTSPPLPLPLLYHLDVTAHRM